MFRVMMIIPFFIEIFFVSVLTLAADWTGAQDYPGKPIRIISSEPGGGSDISARMIAQGATPALGQQVIVENRAGIIAVETVAKAAPDGYTLLLYGSVIWIEPLMRANVPWDALRDFAPITPATRSPNMVVIHPSLSVQSVKELIGLATSRPGDLNYGSAGSGATSHLAAELFRSMTGTNIVRVAYRGNGPAMSDLIGGQLQLMFPTVGEITPHLKSGRVRALAVTTAQPSPLAPGVPTVAESGLPGYESASILGVLAPAKTPATIVNRLNQEFVQVLNRPDAKSKFFNIGLETVGSSPEQFIATIKAETAKWGKVIRDAGIRKD
jgi:tripartite-type tricarboxylate transporter receptor subunit TctC